MKRKLKIMLFLLIITCCVISCADVSPIATTLIEPYGFFSGVWHGLIVPLSFIGSLFSDDIAIYAYNNNGGWYDFGFVIGIGSLFGTSNTKTKN